MKITAELIQKIEKLEQNNISAEEIKEILDLTHSIAEIKAEFLENQDYYTVSESADHLKPILGKLKDEKAYELKVYRLIDKGEIVAEKGSNKTGYRIHKAEIERFIEESKMTKEDWKKRALDAESRIKELEQQLQQMLSPEKDEETLSEAPGQTSIDEFIEASDVKEEMETLEIARADIQNVQDLTTKQKNELKEVLFKDVPKREKLKVEVPAGTTIEEFVKDKIKKPE